MADRPPRLTRARALAVLRARGRLYLTAPADDAERAAAAADVATWPAWKHALHASLTQAQHELVASRCPLHLIPDLSVVQWYGLELIDMGEAPEPEVCAMLEALPPAPVDGHV